MIRASSTATIVLLLLLFILLLRHQFILCCSFLLLFNIYYAFKYHFEELPSEAGALLEDLLEEANIDSVGGHATTKVVL